jgi:hypothetical protein
MGGQVKVRLGGATRINVKLEVGGGVELLEPELWRLTRADDGTLKNTKLGLGDSDESSAEWSLAVRGATEIALTVFWDAMEPMQAKWVYPATITVTDQDGAPLEGANPHVRICKIGSVTPNAGSELESIYAS